MESAITPLIRVSFELYDTLFRFWFPFFIKLDTSSDLLALKLVRNHWILLPWYTEQFLLQFICGLGSITFLIGREIVSSIKTLSLMEAFIFLYEGALELFLILMLAISQNHHEILHRAFNRLVELEHRMIEDLKRLKSRCKMKICAKSKNNSKMEMLHLLMCTIPVGGTFVILFVFPIGLLYGMDPFNYVFDIFLPDPYTRSMSYIIGSYLVRLSMCYIVAIESCRLSIFYCLILLTSTLVAQSLMDILKLGIISGKQNLTYFMQMRVLHSSILHVSSKTVLVGIFIGQGLTVLTICIGLKTWEQFSPIICLTFCLFASGATIFATVMLSLIGHACETMELYIADKQQENFISLGKGTLEYKHWRAQLPCRVYCGSLFVITKMTAITYLEVMLNNVMNVILLFE